MFSVVCQVCHSAQGENELTMLLIYFSWLCKWWSSWYCSSCSPSQWRYDRHLFAEVKWRKTWHLQVIASYWQFIHFWSSCGHSCKCINDNQSNVSIPTFNVLNYNYLFIIIYLGSMVALWLALLPHSEKVLDLNPGLFCVEFARSPHAVGKTVRAYSFCVEPLTV